MKALKITILASFIMLSTLITAQTAVDISAFSQISTSGSVQVELVKSDEFKALYQMKRGDADKLVIENNGDKLIVKIKNKWGIGKGAQAHVVVHYKGDISDISVSAGSSFTANDIITADAMSISVSSGASARANIEANTVDADVSSGGSLRLKGNAKTGSYEASSGASLSAKDLQTAAASADVSSGGSISCWATKSISADASSGGSISYKGNPESKDIDRSSGGSISSM